MIVKEIDLSTYCTKYVLVLVLTVFGVSFDRTPESPKHLLGQSALVHSYMLGIRLEVEWNDFDADSG